MNQKQKTKIIKVIKKDSVLQRRYFAEDPNCDDSCVIGGLVIAAGKKQDFIGKTKSYYNGEISINTPLTAVILRKEYANFVAIEKMREMLCQTYGLSNEELQQLQCINDSFEDVESRRNALIEYIETLPVTE